MGGPESPLRAHGRSIASPIAAVGVPLGEPIKGAGSRGDVYGCLLSDVRDQDEDVSHGEGSKDGVDITTPR